MNGREIIQHAFDSDAFLTSTTTAGYVNPEIWEKELLTYLKSSLVMEQLGKVYDRTNVAGDTFNISVGVEPTAAAAVEETVSVSYQEFSKTQVVFSPSEAATGYQVSQKELDRTFLNTMSEMVEQLGYSMALAIDTDIVSTLRTGASNSIVANGVDSSAIDSSDTLDYDDIINARMELLKDKTHPYALVINPYQEASLLKEQQFSYVQNFGGGVARTGFIGTIGGVEVFVTTQITAGSSKAKAIMLGKDGMGVPPFGILYKRNPYILRDMDIDYRQHKFVGVVDYDVKVLRGNGVCTIETYSA
jgi:N4-gp56 family major capsid protein